MKKKITFRHSRTKLAMLLLWVGWLQSIASGNISQRKEYSKHVIRAAVTDTIPFIADTAAGWHTYSAWVQETADSADMELVVYHTGTHKWEQPAIIGSLSISYIPATQRMLVCSEPERRWRVTILANGQCILKLIEGVPPREQPVVVPLKLKFLK